jgi:anti-anti-sigma factor
MKQVKSKLRPLHIEKRSEALIVCPEGACDRECAEAIDGVISHVDGGTRKDIVLDASRLKYVDTPGFRWLVERGRGLQASGGSLVVAGLRGSAERAFKLLQLDRIIPAAATVEDAIARIRRRAA